MSRVKRSRSTSKKRLRDAVLGSSASSTSGSAGLYETAYSYVCGSNKYGQLGTGSEGSTVFAPQSISLPRTPIKKVVAGGNHTLILTEKGDVYAFGHGEFGQLGCKKESNAAKPVPVTWPSKKVKIECVSAGLEHTVAVSAIGELWTWGWGDYGKLGHGDVMFHYSPKKISFKNEESPPEFKTAAAGYMHTLAVSSKGAIWAFGNGKNGQLGLGDDLSEQHVPKLVLEAYDGVQFKGVAAGRKHSLALGGATADTGFICAAGSNKVGQLGIPDTRQCNSFTKIAAGASFKEVVCGKEHSVAISETGDLWTWGNGKGGRLGHANISQERDKICSVPQLMVFPCSQFLSFISVSAGDSHTVAITEQGDVFSFGNNASGQLGHGETPYMFAGAIDTITVMHPTMVVATQKTPFKSCACGIAHTIFLGEQTVTPTSSSTSSAQEPSKKDSGKKHKKGKLSRNKTISKRSGRRSSDDHDRK